MKFLCTDTETTGVFPYAGHELIEIAAIRLGVDLQEEERMHVKIMPTNIEAADTKALVVNKYYERDWSDAVTIEEALMQFNKIGRGCPLVGHNVSFDWMFLEKAFYETGIGWQVNRRRIDVLGMAFQTFYPDKQFFGFDHICKYLGVVNTDPHTALGDTVAVVECFRKLMLMELKRPKRTMKDFLKLLKSKLLG